MDALVAVVGRVEGAACWLAGTATKGALVGGGAGLVLWWLTAGERLTDWWQGTTTSVLVLLVCVAPALWLVNVRTALAELVDLPQTLGGVAARRAGMLGGRARPSKPVGGVLAAVRTVRGLLRDYDDVVGSWATIAQLLAPLFWVLTLAALVAVPVVAILAAVVALVDFSS